MSTVLRKRQEHDAVMRRYARDQHAKMGARLGNCASGKVAYASKAAVKRHIRLGNRIKYGERPYRCRECGNWHVTTGPRYADAG